MTMRTWRVSVEERVFALFPEYRRGVIWANPAVNDKSPYSLTTLFEEATYRRFGSLSTPCGSEHPLLTCWCEVEGTLVEDHVLCGSSLEAVTASMMRHGQRPLNTLFQDIAAILSLWHCVPVTVYALDLLQEGVILGAATGRERILSQEGSCIEHPRLGEIIAVDGETVLMRNWNNGQAHDGRITCETTAVLMCVDALPPIATAELEGICEEAVSLLDTYCASAACYALLSRHNPQVTVTVR